jgi:hypothetical protein
MIIDLRFWFRLAVGFWFGRCVSVHVAGVYGVSNCGGFSGLA